MTNEAEQSWTPEEVFRARMLEARSARNMSQRALVEKLKDLGHEKMSQAAIARIERGDRKVSLDEAIMIAVALDVAPVNLFLPIADDQAEVRLAPNLAVNLRKARRWARGQIPLRPTNYDFYLSQAPIDQLVSAEELSREQRQERRDRRLQELAGLDEEGIIDDVGAALYSRPRAGGPMELQPPAGLDSGDAGAETQTESEDQT